MMYMSCKYIHSWCTSDMIQVYTYTYHLHSIYNIQAFCILIVLCNKYVCRYSNGIWKHKTYITKPWCLDGFEYVLWYINVSYFSYVLYHYKRFHRPGILKTSIYDQSVCLLTKSEETSKALYFLQLM